MSEGHHTTTLKPMYIVWAWLLGLTLLEVFLAYKQVPIHIMLIALLGMSIAKAALIVSYFMHMKYEKPSLVLTLIPACLMCILLLDIVFPDSVRLSHLAENREPAKTAQEAAK